MKQAGMDRTLGASKFEGVRSGTRVHADEDGLRRLRCLTKSTKFSA